MIPSSDPPNLCSNKKCRKVMDVPRPGWRSKNGQPVDLCNGCFVAYSVGQFCKLYHQNLSCWRLCTSCKKRIHAGCVVSECLYVRSKSNGIKCLDCTPQHEISVANSTGKATSSDPVNRPPLSLNSSDTRPPVESTTPCGESTVGRLIARGLVPSRPLCERRNEDERLAVGSSNNQSRVPPTAKDHIADQEKVSETGKASTPPALVLEFNVGKCSIEAKPRTRKPRSEHRYVPRLTDQELKQMSRGSNVKVTPLFEKQLTVSDTLKIGRLVLPKKCAEDHFPPIDKPEGVGVALRDKNGKTWDFTFRYWPNNNSRMYVLEKFNDYVQAMKLQPGDTVMFGRLRPGGKLVIGHRKSTSASSSSRVGLFQKATSASPSSRKANMVTSRNSNVTSRGKIPSVVIALEAPVLTSKRKRCEMDKVTRSRSIAVLKDNTTSARLSKISLENPNGSVNVDSDMVGSKPSIGGKRKSSEMDMVTTVTSKRFSMARTTLATPSTITQEKPNEPRSGPSNVVGQDVRGRKRKRCRMGIQSNQNKMANLAITFEGTRQELIRSRPGYPQSKIIIDGVKLISYKDGPIIGRPSMFIKHDGDSMHWTQCELCYKWRKVPIDVEIPPKWTCMNNQWDSLRSQCSVRKELSPDMIKNIFSWNNQGSSKKINTGNVESKPVGTVNERDVVVVTPVENDLALPVPETRKVNKKHPRHRPGCACIVCMQPASGSKHKLSCVSSDCANARRRRVLNPRHCKKRSIITRRKPETTKSPTSNRKIQKAPTQPDYIPKQMEIGTSNSSGGSENIPKPPEIGSSNSNHQTVVNRGSEVDQNPNITLNFDLNLLPDDDDMDAVIQVLENPLSRGNI